VGAHMARALGFGLGCVTEGCRGAAACFAVPAPGAALVLAADFRTSSGMVRGGCALPRALSAGRTLESTRLIVILWLNLE
jgi:hypothetical protein